MSLAHWVLHVGVRGKAASPLLQVPAVPADAHRAVALVPLRVVPARARPAHRDHCCVVTN